MTEDETISKNDKRKRKVSNIRVLKYYSSTSSLQLE